MANLIFEVPYSKENEEIVEAFHEEVKTHLDECLKGISYYMTEPLLNRKRVSVMIQAPDLAFEQIRRELKNYFGMHCEFELLRPPELED